jgi:hypothetical protein
MQALDVLFQLLQVQDMGHDAFQVMLEQPAQEHLCRSGIISELYLDLRRLMLTCRTATKPNCFVIKHATDSHEWEPMMTSTSGVVWAGGLLTL